MLEDLHDTSALVQRLTTTSLDQLRILHGRIADAEAIVRALIRQREQQARRDARLRSHGLAVVAAEGH